ncbi:hypothetical protein [Aeoliella sp.]|uniref:hypothetical protein n=1 Tax=Aeoliella sp. TaxID=2795800 RepID=UPI003CCB9D64
MSKEDLYRVAADGNPTRIDKLPTQRLSFEFPITTKLTTPPKLRSFFTGLFCVSILAFLLPLALHFDALIAGIIVAYFILGYLVRTYRRIGTKVAARTGTVFLLTYFSLLMSYKSEAQVHLLLFPATLAYSIYVALLFRKHWIYRASCGILPKELVRNFRVTATLPAGVSSKPTVPAFLAALRSWISYDPHDSQALGVMKSPAGDAQSRVAASSALAVLWAGVLVSPETIVFLSRGGEPLLVLLPFLLVMPVAIPLLLMAAVSEGILGKAHALLDCQFEPKHWTPFIEQLHGSSNPTEAKSVFLGRVHGDGSPILYPADCLLRGGWIQGSPGSGKTLSVMQLQEQLIALGYSVVTLDLKATSDELLWSAHAAVERVQLRQGRHVPIYPFTPVHGEASYLFDLYSQPFWGARSPEEKASIMLGFFGLNGAQVYGESWYRDAAWTVKQHLTGKYPSLFSFHEAAEKLAEELQFAQEPWELSRQVKQDGEHPRLMLRRLGMVDALNARSTNSQEVLDRAIQLHRLFQVPTVLHCRLPAVTDPVGNPEIGRVILSSLFAAAAHTTDRSVKCVVFIDEFQRLTSRQLDLILQQARSQGIGIVLTNQSSADLVAVDPHMADTLAGNLALSAWIKATDSLGVEQVRKHGGQYIDFLYSKSVSNNSNGQQTNFTTTEHILDRVSTGLIDRVNSSRDQYFLRLTDDAGYTAYGGQMFVAQMGFHTATAQDYIDRTLAPWPSAVPGMLVNGAHRPSSGPPSSSLLGPKKKTSPPRVPTPLT